jgi:hypothetical protein
MEIKHNKKRNIGLLTEFFSRYIGEAFLDGRHNDIAKARKIWDKHVHSKSEMHKELQVFNALHETNIKSKELANSLLERTRLICKEQKQELLDKEKESLINEVVSTLNDKSFFDKAIPNYKSYASVQVLMNAWRGTGFKGKFSDLLILEESVLNHVLEEKAAKAIDASDVTTEQIDGLVLKIMTEKFNAKYVSAFNEVQKNIINLYVLSERNEDKKRELSSILEKLRKDTISAIKKPVLIEGLEIPLRKKIDQILTLLESDFASNPNRNDDQITFYLSVAKLKEEMESNK